MNLMRSALLAPLAVLALVAAALPAAAQSSTDVEPDVTIRQEEDRTIREYRVNGALYAIEIRPAAGPAYYLVDRDGDGDFERQDGQRIAVPEWVIKRF
ncbi:hypothetical protein FIU88_01400 [Halomonas sp. THAF12]|uniref:DUF2782 domain-containing protein n=1 Tax=Halomonas sp. THAF12 TaxID=2587849 RepID=UPI0012AA0452|nr:DUF2782 domain-containing protein [Halomonas sp. THAF12]QFT83616.1 hypothetical protein FIU88_01400 [Halomonas sp. THAF12]